MINKRLKTALFAAAAALTCNAQAVNWGATVAYSNLNIEEENNNPAFDGEVDFLSIGATLDTGKPNRVFNYRGTLAYINGDYEQDSGADTDLSGIAVDNTFGFRVGGNANQRIWIGPAIDLQVVELETPIGDRDGIGVGIGASVGMDFYQPTGQFFSLEAGFRRGGLTVDSQDDGFDNGNSFFDNDLELDSSGLFVRGSFFFTGGPKQ